jgi:hypothetical protein
MSDDQPTRILDSKIAISSEVMFQVINDETVILDLKSESYFGLDPTATRIWELLQENQDPSVILSLLESEYDADSQVLKQDLIEHLHSLREAGLITVIEKQPEESSVRA